MREIRNIAYNLTNRFAHRAILIRGPRSAGLTVPKYKMTIAKANIWRKSIKQNFLTTTPLVFVETIKDEAISRHYSEMSDPI